MLPTGGSIFRVLRIADRAESCRREGGPGAPGTAVCPSLSMRPCGEPFPDSPLRTRGSGSQASAASGAGVVRRHWARAHHSSRLPGTLESDCPLRPRMGHPAARVSEIAPRRSAADRDGRHTPAIRAQGEPKGRGPSGSRQWCRRFSPFDPGPALDTCRPRNVPGTAKLAGFVQAPSRCRRGGDDPRSGVPATAGERPRRKANREGGRGQTRSTGRCGALPILAGGLDRQQRAMVSFGLYATRIQVFMPLTECSSMWQWRSQLPGLSATKAISALSRASRRMVSRRGPGSRPSTRRK